MSAFSFQRGGASVLVVEDYADTADSLAVLLRLHGHGVDIARTGAEALAVCRKASPDVIVLDIALPGMNGWEVARQIRQMPLMKAPLLIAVSGYGQDADKRRSAQAGIDLHLTKPVDPDTLMSHIERFRRVMDPPMSSAERRTSGGPVDFGLWAARVEGRMHHFREYARRVGVKTRRTTELTERIERLCLQFRRLGISRTHAAWVSLPQPAAQIDGGPNGRSCATTGRRGR